MAIGGVVADKYRIEALLGEGGMGFVFAALHLQLGHRVALKVLHSSAISDREVTERFLREGRALARLQGEHIARVSDVGTLPNGEPYLVMEFLEGRDLSRELSARGPLPVTEAVDYVAQACEALAEAHVRGIVHRDLKPANLFLAHKLDGEPLVKVLDFGISKISQDDDAANAENITVTSSLVGTPKYMSPEQIQDSRAVDSRTDIWGLGTILYELLTQNRPFAAPSLALVCVKVLHEEVPPPSSIRADIPPGIDEVVARCLKKNPDERYANVGELLTALVPFASAGIQGSAARVTRILAARSSGARLGADSSGSISGLINIPVSIRADSSQPLSRTPSAIRVDKGLETLTAATLHEPSPKKKSRAWIFAAVGGGAALGAALFFALHSSAKPQPTSAPPVASIEVHAPPTPTETARPAETTQASAEPTATAEPTPSATAKLHHAISRPTHHTTHAQAAGSADPQGGGDVLEDRR